MPLIATDYGWGAIFFFIGLPVLNWIGVIITAVAAMTKGRSWWWLVTALPALASAAWISSVYVHAGQFPSWPDDMWQILGFLLPGWFALIATAAIFHNSWRNRQRE
jgi:hypothetical protein